MEIKVREVQERDRDTIVSIITRIDNLIDEERRCAVELMDIYLKDRKQEDYHLLCVVDEGDRPLGYLCYGKASLTDAVYDLYWIAVDPLCQGKGIGRVLMGHLEEVLKDAKARLVIVETSSQPSYDRTRLFYERMGFHEVARLRDFYKVEDDKVIYIKQLTTDSRPKTQDRRLKLGNSNEE
ncbi:MAG: GNAT family N-acetyltransferase [Deltaproteobacteria bacterium]|nr:GNAT family N-acetyltransferase [Deltaproteobacteria bacterium]